MNRQAIAAGRRIRAAWDAAAAGYDAQYGHAPSSAAESAVWRALLDRLFPAGRPLRLLDAGTGTGVIALLLAEAGHSVTGIDLSAAMIAQARAKGERAGLASAWALADARELPFAGAAFDAVVSRYLLWTLPEPEPALAEWRRVLRPGGRIVAIDSLAPRPRPLPRLLRAAAHLSRARAGAEHAPPPAILTAAADCPLNSPAQPAAAAAAFHAVGLRQVRAIELRRFDARLRAAMPLRLRWLRDYRRYLVSAVA